MKLIARSLPLVALLGIATVAHAQTPIMDFTGGLATSPNGDTIGGVEFRVSSTINIDALGVWDEGADGLAHSHDVGLWNFDGSVLIASTTVTNAATPVASTSVDGRWLAVSVGNIVLTPGTYVLGGTFLDQDPDLSRLLATASSIPGVTFGTAREKTQTSSLAFPDQILGNANDGIFGPNAFLLAPANVPEPGSVALLVGMASVSGMMLRRRRK